jgi:hypothetical protein
MDDYIKLSELAKQLGGPEKLIRHIKVGGVLRGIAIGGAAATGIVKGVDFALKKSKARKAAASAVASAETRKIYTVGKPCEAPGGLKLRRGDQYQAHTRDGDVIMIEIHGNDDNPYFVSGALLEQISDFKLHDIDDF